MSSVPEQPDYDLPDVDPGNDGPADLREIRALLADHIERIASLIHYADAVPAGRQWAIPLSLSCGFDGELVIRVRSMGSCPRPTAQRRAGAES